MNILILILIVEAFVIMILFEYLNTTIQDDKPVSKEVYKSLLIAFIISIILYLYIKS